MHPSDIADSRIIGFADSYVELERRVRSWCDSLCGPFCSACPSPCCKVDFCRESMDSPFLKRLVADCSPRGSWSETCGWLTPAGCVLDVGRPPVCFSFFCGAIAMAQPSPLHLYALSVLSALISFVGRNARARRHLVEVTDLGRINVDRLTRQCTTAQTVLGHLDHFWRGGPQAALDLDLCKQICRPPFNIP